MALNNDQITAQNFKDFYGQIRPYLNGTAHGGFTPIGTVISVMGKQAPLNYLVCDGTVYNIADYPELAAYFVGQFEASNFFGGNGTTTFAVPDLRGEFLRGTGTNSHTNQGSGANVGEHQDSTGIPNIVSAYDGLYMNNIPPSGSIGPENIDGGYKKNASGQNASVNLAGKWASTSNNMFLLRPTNTSVLYCIATKNIFMDAGHNYSTDEQVVGTWIDGKPIYQKTLTGTTDANSFASLDTSSLNIEQVVSINGFMLQLNNDKTNCVPFDFQNESLSYYVSAYWSNFNNTLQVVGKNYSNTDFVSTIQYTKTTD